MIEADVRQAYETDGVPKVSPAKHDSRRLTMRFADGDAVYGDEIAAVVAVIVGQDRRRRALGPGEVESLPVEAPGSGRHRTISA